MPSGSARRAAPSRRLHRARETLARAWASSTWKVQVVVILRQLETLAPGLMSPSAPHSPRASSVPGASLSTRQRRPFSSPTKMSCATPTSLVVVLPMLSRSQEARPKACQALLVRIIRTTGRAPRRQISMCQAQASSMASAPTPPSMRRATSSPRTPRACFTSPTQATTSSARCSTR